ncbi:MAG: amidase, partial [Lewinella sp.]|nr:amidase [Lewinella sp.]
DKIGPLARSAEDCLLVLDAIQGADHLDHAAIDAPLNYQSSDKFQRNIRIGYTPADFQRRYPFHEQDSLVLTQLESLGFELVPIELPDFPPISHILTVEAAAAFDELTRSNRDDELVRQVRNAWPNTFRAARFVPAVEYVQANRARTQLIQAMEDEVFQQVDLYVHPSWASPSLRITNYTGHPCLVVPNGFQDNGRPTSITFTGKLYDEGTLVAVGQAWQEVTEWDERHPGGF